MSFFQKVFNVVIFLGANTLIALEDRSVTPLETQTYEGRSELIWHAGGQVQIYIPAPEFAVNLQPFPQFNWNSTFQRSLTRTVGKPSRGDNGQTCWKLEISVAAAKQVYRADYIMRLAPSTGPARGRLTISCELNPHQPMPFDLCVKQHIRVVGLGSVQAIVPQREGNLAQCRVEHGSPVQAGWVLGSATEFIGAQLALPLIGLRKVASGATCSIATDPYLGVHMKLLAGADPSAGVTAELGFAYKGLPPFVPLSTQTRTLELALHGDSTDALFETFYQTIPEIKPGPAWIHDIQLNHYDYIAETGKSLEPDLEALAKRIPEKYRKHVIVCLHGYYDYLGRYTFNSKTRRMDDSWKAYDKNARELPMTKAELHRRMRLVKERGFRCGIYFFDSLAYEDAIPEFNREWVQRNDEGKPATWYYWQSRPDSKGRTNYMLNPSHPEVRQWFLDYTKALIDEYGRDLDALVWDESKCGQRTRVKLAGNLVELDRAMMRLMTEVTRQVQQGWSVNPDLALLTCDVIDSRGAGGSMVPLALVAHGSYQDSHCDPRGWMPARFPNYRNCVISCNWEPVRNRDWNRIAVEEYSRPQGVSNGWGDDQGPSEMPAEILDEIIGRFLKRVEQADAR